MIFVRNSYKKTCYVISIYLLTLPNMNISNISSVKYIIIENIKGQKVINNKVSKVLTFFGHNL